ncbi:MAG: diacylglycerol O-acyltransferase 1 [Icmadophila ericetorum]|nr:diacylglycerol O-acyltransferase 1 [Icmadophila ericetorum]
MAPAVLNAEPSQPIARKEQHLPPKSYADAAHENMRTNGDTESDTPTEYVGDGKEDITRSPVRKGHKRVKSQNGGVVPKKPLGAGRELVNTYQDADGHKLTSVKATEEFEENLSLDKKEQRRTELTSGRTPGAGWAKSGIRWAPLNVPLKRRLQTLVVLWHTISIPLFITAFFFLCAIPIFWPILIPYLIYLVFSNTHQSGTLRRRSNFFRSLPIWSLFASYFPARLHRSQELPPTRKYIFGYHPHGIISHGAFAAFATEALGFSHLFPGITNSLLTLDSNFRIPLYREYALALGLGSVSRTSCENLLSKGGTNGEGMGRAITIVVGGARESLDALPGSLKLVLKRRKGFVRMAIRTGADLVPVLAFGENDLYNQIQVDSHPLIHKSQLLVKKFLGFTIPLLHARGVFNYDVGMMPYRRPLNVVVGRPIKVWQQGKPEDKYVDEVHGLYVEELRRVWEEWRGEFSPGTEEMEIIE